MRCEQMHELFSPYLDEMTSQKETELIEAHLRECTACQQHLAEMRRMCTLLGQLEAPQVPERFAADLHKRLANEKVKIFAPREIMTPKKSGWLVAGVASIALSIGILASSFMPNGAMVALQNLVNTDKVKPSFIDNNRILEEWAQKQGDSQIAVNFGEDPEPKANPQTSVTDKTGQAITANDTVTDPVTVNVAVKERLVDTYSVKANVDSIDDTVSTLQQLADANSAQFSVQKSSQTMIASAASTTKIIALQVPKENVEQVLKQLAGIGVGVPSKDTADYTEAYAEAEKVLIEIGQDIKRLESQTSLSEEQQKQLQQLQERQIDLLAEKKRIDRGYNFVTIQIRLVEDINP